MWNKDGSPNMKLRRRAAAKRDSSYRWGANSQRWGATARRTVARQIRALRTRGYKPTKGLFISKEFVKGRIIATPRPKGVGLSVRTAHGSKSAPRLGGVRTSKQKQASRMNLKKARLKRGRRR